MNRTYNYLIDNTTENQTIEQFLLKRGFSRKLIVHLKKTPLGITINGVLAYITYHLHAGELLTICLLEKADSQHILPVHMELDIVYEDDDLMIINKAANMPVHPSHGHYDNTLANGVAHYFKEKNEPFVFRAINRLDRDTTGLLILAKHLLSASILYERVRNHQIKREYLAVATGYIDENGTINAPIARVTDSVIERCVDLLTGESACTHYEPIAYDKKTDCTLIRLRLETGRTHQIRVHMKYIGHPLPGDFLYHPDYQYISRQALHSYRLTFHHPLTEQPLSFTAPLPDDMKFNFFSL